MDLCMKIANSNVYSFITFLIQKIKDILKTDAME